MPKTHQQLGNELKLFFFDDVSPGSCFFLPHGTRIYRKLQDYMRQMYNQYEYTEVITPNIYNQELWEQSGHWDKYKEHMFLLSKHHEEDEKTMALKAMNCPSHCMMYPKIVESYRDLPIRLADFGALHRNELRNTLRGLTRVRRFQQDDAHIFCTIDQIDGEIASALQFLKEVYSRFGFEYEVELSTRPEKYIGSIEAWDMAEKILLQHIQTFPKYTINEGDGAFYGPKIDVIIKDSLGRQHQCGTLQLDFNLPERFKLSYATDEVDRREQPVIIHRAIYGSFERFIAIVLEHTQGLLPFWLSPRQIMVIPINNKFVPDIEKSILPPFSGFHIDLDKSDNTLDKKIRDATVLHYNYIFVVGKRELDSQTVNIRMRDGTRLGTKTIADTMELLV